MSNLNGPNTVGIINEIGDLGLGFEPISDEDLEKIKGFMQDFV